MPVTPTGSVALPVYLLRRMVANSSTFQTAVGASNVTEALDYIDLKEGTGDRARPCAIINAGDTRYSLIAGGDQNHLRSSGSVILWLAMDRLETDTEDDALLRFTNFAGGVADDVAALAGRDQTADSTVPNSQLNLTSMDLEDMAETPREVWQSIGRFWWACWRCNWGDQ